MADFATLLRDHVTLVEVVRRHVELRRAFWVSMRDFTAGGRTVLFATHCLDEPTPRPTGSWCSTTAGWRPTAARTRSGSGWPAGWSRWPGIGWTWRRSGVWPGWARSRLGRTAAPALRRLRRHPPGLARRVSFGPRHRGHPHLGSLR